MPKSWRKGSFDVFGDPKYVGKSSLLKLATQWWKWLKVRLTSKALRRSSLEWEAEMQMRARANNNGVAGKATVTTATYDIIIYN